MNTTLDHKDGWLCVRYETTMSDKPEKMILWWPILKDYHDNWKDEIGLELRGHASGTYELCMPNSGRRMEFRLRDGGSTKAIASDVVAVDPPKVRKGTEIRWHYGTWQKYSKTKGWVNA